MSTNKLVWMLTNVWFPGLKPSEIAAKMRRIADELDQRVQRREMTDLNATDLSNPKRS